MAPFRLTGKHVLAMLVGFFAVIILANAIFITFAIRSFPGEQEKKSYVQGLNYNARLAALERQAALGWRVEIAQVNRNAGETGITLVYKSADGAPISGLKVAGTLTRPATDNDDISADFAELSTGAYFGSIIGAESGQWRFTVTAISAGNEQFDFETKLILE